MCVCFLKLCYGTLKLSESKTEEPPEYPGEAVKMSNSIGGGEHFGHSAAGKGDGCYTFFNPGSEHCMALKRSVNLAKEAPSRKH